MLVSHMLYKTAQSSKAHKTESVSVMGHQLSEWEWVPQDRTKNSKTSLTVSRCSGAWHYKVTTCSGTEVTTIGWFRHRWAQLSEVCRCGLMQTLVHQDTHCIQFSAERAANAVDLKRQWWCGRTSTYAVWFELQRWARSVEAGRADTVEDTVTVVHTTRDERVCHGCGSIFRKWLPHSIRLPQMVKILARQASDIGCEGQRTVEQHWLPSTYWESAELVRLVGLSTYSWRPVPSLF